MSQNYSSTYSSSSSYSYSSSTSRNGQTTGHTVTQHSQITPDGTTIHRSSQIHGQPQIRETRYYDSQGRQTLQAGNGDDSVNNQRRIEEVKDEQDQDVADRKYAERIEDEYAKREGGA